MVHPVKVREFVDAIASQVVGLLSLLKLHLKFLETVCEEIGFLSGFWSQVLLLAYCLTFKMRYWGGLCDLRKNY